MLFDSIVTRLTCFLDLPSMGRAPATNIFCFRKLYRSGAKSWEADQLIYAEAKQRCDSTFDLFESFCRAERGATVVVHELKKQRASPAEARAFLQERESSYETDFLKIDKGRAPVVRQPKLHFRAYFVSSRDAIN